MTDALQKVVLENLERAEATLDRIERGMDELNLRVQRMLDQLEAFG